MTNSSEILGQRIRMYRKKNHMSQEKLAELSGLHPTYVGQMERGEKNPTIESLLKICKAMHLPIAVLVEKLDEYALTDDCTSDYIMKNDDSIPLQAYELISREPYYNQVNMLHLLTYASLLKK